MEGWVKRRITEAREKQLTKLDLSDGGLKEIPAEVLKLSQLTSLNLSGNEITRLPPDLERLENLRKLSLYNNSHLLASGVLLRLQRLERLSLCLVGPSVGTLDLSRLPKLQHLDVGYNRLTSLPPAILDLPDLRELLISGNQFGALPQNLSRLKRLEGLDLGGHPLTCGELVELSRCKALTDLSLYDMNLEQGALDELARFEVLTNLSIWNCGLTEVPSDLTMLSRLVELKLIYNEISEIPAELLHLPGLRALSLCGNPLQRLPESVLELHELRELDMSGIQQTPLLAIARGLKRLTCLTADGCGVTDLPQPLFSLKALKVLRLGDNQLTTIPDQIGELTKLQSLALYNNHLRSLPSSLCSLEELAWIHVGENALAELPPDIGNLQRLETLHAPNNSLTRLPSSIARLRYLKTLGVSDNPLENPPPEIVEQGVDAIQNYLATLAEAPVRRLHEAKLIIVGEGAVGKTCLAHKIVDPDFDIDADNELIKSTRGIAIKGWTVDTKASSEFRVNVWDFGGQEIYHSTHQFFLTKRSLYLFVWDARKEDKTGGFDYWLNVIKLLSDQSTVLVVLNKVDERVKEIDEAGIKAKFENIAGYHKVSTLTGQGMDHLRDRIRELIADLPHIGDIWPERWTAVRARLEGDSRDYIERDEYLKICSEESLDGDQAAFLSSYLNDLGVILHFQEDPVLNGIVILNPEWGTNAVYRVLDTREVQNARGRFSYKHLRQIWSDPSYASRHAELLRLMIKFELAFQVANSEDYIAPELLSAERPTIEWTPTQEDLRFEYHYSFMPAGIVTRFIARNHPIIEGDGFWHDGVLLRWEGARALVVCAQLNRRITVTVQGRAGRSLLDIIRRDIDHIHGTLNNPDVDERIPCPCAICVCADQPFLFDYRTLRQWFEKGVRVARCGPSAEEIPISRLLEGIHPMRVAGSHADGGTRIYNIEHYHESDQQPQPSSPAAEKVTPRSAWTSGLFYLFAFISILATFAAMIGETLPIWALPGIIIGGLLAVTTIGALQLQQDRRLSEKRFLELMKLAFAQIPLLGKLGSLKEK